MRGAAAAPALLAIAAVPAAAQQSSTCGPEDLSSLDDWRGVWLMEGALTGISGRTAGGDGTYLPLVGFDAPWNDQGWARREAMLRYAFSGNRLQSGWAFPVMMSSPAPFRFFITPSETVIVSQYREVRYVPTDGAGQVDEYDRWPTIWGTSFGCWDGDTLVIETDSVTYTPEFNWYAPILSDEAHFVERLRMTGPDRIENSFTITDPETLAEPWTGTVVYERHPVLQRLVHEGEMTTGNRVIVVEGEDTFAPLPETGLPPAPEFPAEIERDTAELDRFAGTYGFDDAPLVLTVERRGNRLFARQTPGWPPVPLPLYAYADGAFHSRVWPLLQFRFETDASGITTGFTGVGPDGLPISGRKQQ